MNLGIALLVTVSASLSVFAEDAPKPASDKPQTEKAPPGKDAAPGAPAALKPPVDPNSPVRLQFVPAKKGEGKGASGTALARMPFDPETLTAMISIGVGDSFPIHSEKGQQLFMLHMTAGDDKHLVFEVRSQDAKQKDAKEAVQKIAVVRDDATDVTVNGVKYEIRYPTMRVNPTANPITHEATVFVAQRP